MDNKAVKWATGESTKLKPRTQAIKNINQRCCASEFICVETQ